MFITRVQRSVARSIVTILAFGFIQVGLAAPQSNAASAPIKPTITSITSNATSLTVNMQTTGIDATQWRWAVTSRTGVSCANTYGNGVIQSTGSLSSTISVTGLTAGCTYSVKVAGYNGVIGEYTDAEKLVGAYTNGVTAYYANDANSGASMIHVPIKSTTSGYCGSESFSTISKDWSTAAPAPTNTTGASVTCNSDNFTVYFVGYLKAPITGNVTIKTRTDDSSYVNIQGANAISDTATHGPAGVGLYDGRSTIYMVSGEIYRLEMWMHEVSTGAAAYLDWEYSGVSQTNIPNSHLATDPSVFYGTCPIGLAARCAGDSAYQIKLATGANMNGQYWINVNGTPTLTYCIMDSNMAGGGWMLAMKGKQSATGSTFSYSSPYWTNTTQLNDAYPERWLTGDTQRDIDAKYGVFSYNKGNQIMALYPEQTGYAGGATNSQNATYGFSWIETTTAGRTWTSSDGDSWNVTNLSAGLPTGSNCVTTASTLTYLFANSNRCVFRRVQSTYSASESPYSAIGNNLFFSQKYIGFFGINYGNSNGNTLARWGFGWNENDTTNEWSNDGVGGIGIKQGTYGATAGSVNGCCSNYSAAGNGQAGISGNSDGSSRNIPFELYTRNSVTSAVNGSNLRVTYKRSNSLTAGNGYTAPGTNGSNTFRLSPVTEGFSIDSTTGAITVSDSVGIGTYTETVTVIDTNGVVGVKQVSIQVLADSSDTDTALSFTGAATLWSAGTFSYTGDQTWEAWVRPGSSCQSTQKTVIGSETLVVLCISGYWWLSFRDSAGGSTWYPYKTSREVNTDVWTHIALVRSGTSVSFYVNNAQVRLLSGSAWVSSVTVTALYATASNIYLGGHNGGQYYSGEIDEFKIWSEARSLQQITDGMHSAPNLSSPNLLHYWDFNEGTGTSAVSRGQRSEASSNFTPLSSQWVNVISSSNIGPYTYVYFKRSLISKNPGWVVPESITAISVVIVGGGGGGGGGYQGGGGGGGAVIETKVAVSPKSAYAIKVGMGGRGALNPFTANNGDSSTAFSLTAVGGGAGGSEFQTPYLQVAATSGASGGGGVWGNYMTGASGTSGFKGGDVTNLESPTCSPSQYAGAGGGGAASAGGAPICTRGGIGGNGISTSFDSNYYGGGGGGSLRSATTSTNAGTSRDAGRSGYVSGALSGAIDGPQFGGGNTGGGGGAGSSIDGASGFGADGGSGYVMVRYITALKPAYTAPQNAYLNVGMTETFTTNVASDSATPVLTRTFRWESSTTGINGTFSLIKQGTGADNAYFSWIPTDTATTGNQYVYRVIVTDSDTAGLFIQDTSTAVYATINGTLALAGSATVTKTVGISKTETFTVVNGTPTYRYTLSPTNTLIMLDTATVGLPKIKLADTLTVGTYYETLTIIDSVSASAFLPLTIIVNAPPSFSANTEQVDSGTVLYLDPGNKSSYSGSGTTWTDLSGRNLSTTLQPTGMNALGGAGADSCAKVGYSTEALGVMTFSSASKTCAYTTGLGVLPVYTAQVWVKRDGDVANDYISVIATPYNSNKQINISLHWMSSNVLEAGIFRNNTWPSSTGFATSPVIPDKTWVFATITFDGTTITLTTKFNGNTYSDTGVPSSTAFSAASMIPNLIIGKRFDGDNAPTGNYFFNGSIGSIRIYNRVLTSDEILQNFNATVGRFSSTQNKQSQIGKYGTIVVDTYTVTAGSETITATFGNPSTTKFSWDTSTARSLILTVVESLTPGTYTDTATITDIYGATTNLKITLTVNKADTITVYIDTPTAINYTGSTSIFSTVEAISGFVGEDTGTVTTIKYKPGGTSCATGGVCNVGDIGPGGGIVFITPSTAGGNGRYFEVAPSTWAGDDDVSTTATYCSNSNSNIGSTNIGIGWGETNTSLAKTSCLGGAVAKVNNFNLSNTTGYSDWFIPSKNEMTELAKVRSQAGLIQLGANWTVGRNGYWTSTESSAGVEYALVTSSWTVGSSNKSETSANMVRPVRMFTPCWAVDTCTSLSSTSKPVQAGTYSITPSGLTASVGTLDNYVAVQYVATTVTINKIAQDAQIVPFYNPNFPDTMTVLMRGGSGTGARVYTVSNGSASGCVLDYKKLNASTPGTCNVQSVKLGDRNYLADTVTANIYFILFVINQPSNGVGSGPSIALNGQTSITLDSNQAPTISSVNFVGYTCVLSLCTGPHWEIIGSGFGASDNTTTVVKFWRNQVVTLNQNYAGLTRVLNDTLIQIAPEDVPVGAVTGKIIVVTPNGIAVSPYNWVKP